MKVMHHTFTTHRTTLIAPKGKRFLLTKEDLVKANLLEEFDSDPIVGLGGVSLQMNSTMNYSEIPEEKWMEWFGPFLIDEMKESK